MTTFGGPIFGGYGMGWGFAPGPVKLDAPLAEPDAPAKPGDPLEREAGYFYGVASAGLPGFTKAPNGCDAVWWQMRKYSACWLAYTVTTRPIFAGTRTLEICQEDGTPAKKRAGGPLAGDGVKEGPEDKIKADMTRHFDPLWPDILNGLEALNMGRWSQEVRWARKNGLTLPTEFRDFLPWEVGILYDKYRDFAGVRYQEQDRAPQYVLHHVHQPHLDRLNGYPRLENCRGDWWHNHETEDRLGRAEAKASGISLMLLIDHKYAFRDSSGNKVSQQAAAQTFVNALAAGGTAMGPRYVFDSDTIKNKPELAKEKPIEAQQFDWGQTAPAILACLSVLDARDKRIFRAYGRLEREALEGQHGTKAEAGVHTQTSILDCEAEHSRLVRQFNQQTWRYTLLTNYGDKYLDRLYWKPTPLADDSKQFIQDAVKTMLAAPGDPLSAMVDRKAILQKAELPYDESYAPQPALPTGPTPPEGGGTNGQPGANGNGNPDRMKQLGLSAGGWPDGGGPFDDGGGYALALNCGTGNGGFQPNNVCSKGGRQFVVSKVTRAGMVHGRGADESPDVPPVELGHVSEFTAPLSDAPLPEFASRVQAIGDKLPGFSDNKIYLSTLYDAAHAEDSSLMLGDFKAKMKAANTEGLLKLSRADIPLNPAEEARSEIVLAPGAEAHYLLVRSDANRRQVARVR